MEALESYLVKRNTLEGLLPDEKAVFITRRRKTRITNRRVEQLVTGAMEAAGLKGFSTHKLRHTAATLMYQTGHVDILTLKELLGHSNLSTTQIYTHLNGAQVRAAVEANPLGNARTGTETKKSDVQAQFDASGASKIERTEPQNDHPATVVVLPETNGTHLPSEMLYTSDSVDMATESQAPNKKR
jgi:site-specific recombinase XerC